MDSFKKSCTEERANCVAIFEDKVKTDIVTKYLKSSKCYKVSRTTSPNTIVTSHVHIFNFKLIKIKVIN